LEKRSKTWVNTDVIVIIVIIVIIIIADVMSTLVHLLRFGFIGD